MVSFFLALFGVRSGKKKFVLIYEEKSHPTQTHWHKLFRDDLYVERWVETGWFIDRV